MVTTDTARNGAKAAMAWLTRRDALILAGGIAATAAVAPLDRPIEREFDEPHWRNSGWLHHTASDLAFFGGDGPFVASAVVFATGSALGKASFERFALHNMEAIALATAIAGIGKGIAGRALPGVNTKHSFEWGRGFHDANGPFVSFPSGHTAAAFAMAATVAGEIESADSLHAALVGRVVYGMAGAVGIARLVQRVHWPSDLPLAVVIGVWSGHAVQAHAHDASRSAGIVHGLMVTRRPDGRTWLGWSSAGIAHPPN